MKNDENSGIVVATWNVLFELFDKGLEADDQFSVVAQARNTGLESSSSSIVPEDACFSELRWKELCSFLQSTDADIISLQEVTPDFLKVLCGQSSDWIRKDFAISAAPSAMESVTPSGGKSSVPSPS